MTTPSFSVRRPGAANLSIRPPSPSHQPPPAIVTPQNQIQPPRPVIPSPTHSNRSSSTGAAAVGNDHPRRGSFETSRSGDAPSRRGQLPPWIGNLSPSRRGESKGGYAGAYDNKLVSSTVSHLPPIPPVSPTFTGSSIPNPHNLTAPRASYDLNHLHPHTISSRRTNTALSSSAHTGSVIVLPDGTVLSSAGTGSNAEGKTVAETMAHSSANSPWNVLIVHVLPVFGGGPVHTSIEELNGLSLSHIVASSGRVPTSRLIAVLSGDLREFIGSGMLTFKAKFDNYDEIKLVARVAEQWQFFWAQVLPYLEGILLPFTQIKDQSHSTTISPIHVRNLLLTGFFMNIIQPILSRLVEFISLAPSTSPTSSSTIHPSQLPQPTPVELQRILQMSLILATQARCSSFYPFRSAEENHEYDKQIRENLDELGKSVRWRVAAIKRAQDELASPSGVGVGMDGAGAGPRDGVGVTDEFGMPKDGNASAPKRHSLHRGPSLSQSGRFRRRGWRASANMSQVYGEEPTPTPTAASFLSSTSRGLSRQGSDYGYPYTGNQEWHPTLAEEDDEDDNTTPGQSCAGPIPPSREGYGTNSNPNPNSNPTPTTTFMSETPSTYTSTSASTLRGTGNGNGNGNGQGQGYGYGYGFDDGNRQGQGYGFGQGNGDDDWEASQRTPQAGSGAGFGTGPAPGMYPRRRQTSGPGSRSSTPGPGAGPPEVRRRETGRL